MCRVAGFSASVSKYVICSSFIYLHSTHSLARRISIYPFNIQSVHTSIRAFPSASCAKSVTGFESLNELTYATKASFSCLDIVNRRAWSDWEGRRVARRSPEQQRIIRKMATSLAGRLSTAQARMSGTNNEGWRYSLCNINESHWTRDASN